MTLKVPFYVAVSESNRVTIFVPPGEFDAAVLGEVHPADLVVTDRALILKIHRGDTVMMATNLRVLDDIRSGLKEIWISHLHPTLGYVLDQARLEFAPAA